MAGMIFIHVCLGDGAFICQLHPFQVPCLDSLLAIFEPGVAKYRQVVTVGIRMERIVCKSLFSDNDFSTLRSLNVPNIEPSLDHTLCLVKHNVRN
ncbi:hypothetical protein FOXYSP1_13552 [Fusarium oxysporum f. sp. phaseoli]